MPITPIRLDDRTYQDLVDELLARVPAHTPEWVPAQAGDPGRTLIELFAWLADTILYRANLVPERQRLAFLQLLGMPMRAARAARGVVGVAFDENNPVSGARLAAGARLPGPVDFETLSELNVLPVTGECYYKRALSGDELAELADVIEGLRQFHRIEGDVDAYVTTPVFVDGMGLKRGLDVVQETADRSLWMALLAARPEDVEAVKLALAGGGEGGEILNIGVAPAIEVPGTLDEVHRVGALTHGWSISTDELLDDRPVYSGLRRVSDTTGDYARSGVERLVLPGGVEDFGVLEGDARHDANAGVGDRPPRIDDPERLARIVAWLRLRPGDELQSMNLSWVGVNAVEIDQRRTLRDRVVGQGDGGADQVVQLPVASVDAGTLELQVEEPEQGYRRWREIDDLALADRDDRVYRLDTEAGTVHFGNGIYGRVPEAGSRIRVASLRAGGGAVGNLPAGTLREIEAHGLDGSTVSRKLKVIQGLATDGGVDAETLEEAERRIPARLNHRNRAVTESDYRSLAAETPGTRIGRIEVLPRFLPRQRRSDVPGVVSVMVLPQKSSLDPPHPRPDQPLIRKVHDYLSARRPLATELYVIGCEYVPIAVSVGITIKPGFGRDQVEHDVRRALQQFLAPLPPAGPTDEGWPLGRAVDDRELEVVVARVRGVNRVAGVNLFQRHGRIWRLVARVQACEPVAIDLLDWQLPELLAVRVDTDGSLSETVFERGTGSGRPGDDGDTDGDGGVALPVVPETC